MRPSWPNGAICAWIPTIDWWLPPWRRSGTTSFVASTLRRRTTSANGEADTLLTSEKRQRLLALATDFPRLWRDPATPSRERKRMARLLIEDVTLLRCDELLDVHVRFRGGATRSLQLPRPKPIAICASWTRPSWPRWIACSTTTPTPRSPPPSTPPVTNRR